MTNPSSSALHAKRIGPTLVPDRSRVLLRPFRPTTDDISRRVIARVMALPEAEVVRLAAQVLAEFSDRHERVEDFFRKRFAQVKIHLEPADQPLPSPERQLLIGAYFTHEYSPESAALFNPSIVPHPDQSGVPKGALRFILSLRATGEGHISSITFRTGLFAPDGAVIIDPASTEAISPRIEYMPGGAPDDPGVRLFCEESRSLSEIVIFPITFRQRHGIAHVVGVAV